MKKSTTKVVKKKRGRPATGRDPIVGLRVPAETRARIEKWAMRQADEPTLSEAIRRLIEIALD